MDLVKYTDIDVEFINEEKGISVLKKCHKLILGCSSKLFDDMLSIIQDNSPLKILESDCQELVNIFLLIDHLYSGKPIPISTIKCILKYQMHTCAIWILKNELQNPKLTVDEIEDMYILIFGNSIWDYQVSDLNISIDLQTKIIMFLFYKWLNFENGSTFSKFIQNVKLDTLIKLVLFYKSYSNCDNIISVLIIKWCIYHSEYSENDRLKLSKHINFRSLSRPFRLYFMNSLYKMGATVLNYHNIDILNILYRNNVKFDFDTIDKYGVDKFTVTNFINNPFSYTVNIDNGIFKNISIEYIDKEFKVKLNNLCRYHNEEINMDIDFNININVLKFDSQVFWIHLCGVFKTGDTYVDYVKIPYNFEFILDENDNGFTLKTSVFLKLNENKKLKINLI